MNLILGRIRTQHRKDLFVALLSPCSWGYELSGASTMWEAVFVFSFFFFSSSPLGNSQGRRTALPSTHPCIWMPPPPPHKKHAKLGLRGHPKHAKQIMNPIIWNGFSIVQFEDGSTVYSWEYIMAAFSERWKSAVIPVADEKYNHHVTGAMCTQRRCCSVWNELFLLNTVFPH